MKKFSAAHLAFFDVNIHGDDIPSDAVDVTDAEWEALLASRTSTNRLCANEQGRPVLLPLPPPTNERLALILRRRRNDALKRTDWLVSRHADQIAVGDSTTLSHDEYLSLLQWRQSLRNVTAADGFPAIALPSPPAFIAL